MKNNSRGLIFHILISIIVFIIAFILNINANVRNLVYGNTIFKIILAVIPLILYFNFGKLMSKKYSKALDFFAGNLIILIGIVLFIFGFIILRMDFFKISIGANVWKFPLEVFLFVQIYQIKVLGISYNFLSLIIFTFLPTIIYGMSIKISRNKMIRINRMRNRKERVGRNV